VRVVRDRRNSFRKIPLSANNTSISGHNGLSLQMHVDALLLCLTLLDGVLLHTVQKLVSGSGVRDVFDPDVNALLDIAVADTPVDNDTDRGFGYVINHARLAVVDLVGHTLLHSTVDLDIDNVTNTILLQVSGHRYIAMFPEAA